MKEWCTKRSDAASCSLHISSDNLQGNVRDEVEQENADFEKCHPSVVQGVKLLHRQMQPSTVLHQERSDKTYIKMSSSAMPTYSTGLRWGFAGC